MSATALQEIDVALPRRKWPRYPNYTPMQAAWLDKAPAHWDSKRLKYAVALINSKQVASESELPYVGMENIESGTGKYLANGESEQAADGLSNSFRTGDVLFGKLRPYLAKAHFASFDGLCSSELLVFRPRMFLSQYLLYLVLTEGFVRVVDSSTYGAKMPRASWEFIGNLRVPLPPLDEQRAIAAFLDRETARIDELIAKKQRLIELLKEKRQAVISRAVTKGLNPNAPLKPTGIDWLGEIPAHWTIRAFRYSGRITNGQVDPEQPEYRDLPLIAPNHIESGTGRLLDYDSAAEQAAESGKYLFEPENVLYSKIRPALAKVCLAPERGLCSADMYPITPRNDLRPLYLMYFMLSPEFTTGVVLLSSRVAMPKMNRRDLGGFAVLVPPLAEQDAIIEHLREEHAKIDSARTVVEMAIDKLRQYRSALITAAVTGQIDVRHYGKEAT
jgi:type I restriction enzyme S subunit